MKVTLSAILTIILSVNLSAQKTLNEVIHFDHNRYDLTNEAKSVLDKCFTNWKDNSFLELIIIGHTDADGSDIYNTSLSKNRARAVFDYFLSKGIPEDKMRVQFFGETKPIAENDNDQDKQSNRRVEIIIKKDSHESDLKFEKQAQVFTIKPGRDTTLHCGEGTIIRINANTLVTKSKGKAVTGNITFSVTEFYKLSDMILSDLSTTSDGELLETAGMIYITATSGVEELSLKEGESIEISFPKERNDSNMQLFTGSWINKDLINWTTQTSPEEEIILVPDISPEFTAGSLYAYLQTNLRYPPRAKELGAQGTVYTSFVVTDQGKVRNPRILRGIMPDLDDEALNVLKNMPDWKPGKLNGKNVNVQYSLPIRFSLGMSAEDTLIGWQGNYKERFEKIYNDTTVQKASFGTILNYVFNSTQLGWINLDAYMFKSRPTNYIVKLDEDIEDVKIIFNSYRSIMEVMPKSGVYTFYQVPSGEDITIVAVKRIDNTLHLAVKQSNTSQKIEKDLVFQPVTMELLKSEMQKFDRLR